MLRFNVDDDRTKQAAVIALVKHCFTPTHVFDEIVCSAIENAHKARILVAPLPLIRRVNHSV